MLPASTFKRINRMNEKEEQRFQRWKEACEDLLATMCDSVGANASYQKELGTLMLDKAYHLLCPHEGQTIH